MNHRGYIEIFKGDDTDALGYQTITARIDTTLDISGCRAVFSFLDFSQTFETIPEDRMLEIVIPSSETAKFPFGIQFAKLKIYDASEKVRTFANRIPVIVTDRVFDQDMDEFVVSFNPLPQVLAGGTFDLNGTDLDFREKVAEIWKMLGGQTQYEDRGDYANIKLKYSEPQDPEDGDAYQGDDLVWRIYKNGEWAIFGGGGGGESVQSNWTESNPSSPAFIKNKPTSFAPSAHASTHAANGSDPITPEGIGALEVDGTAAKAEVLRNNATWQEAEIVYDEQHVARIEVYDRSQSQSGQLVGKVAYTGDIPALAAPSTESTAQGKAADAKATAEFVNSSINNLAAFYLTADAQGNAFATKAALTSATTFYNGGVARTPTKNDYLIVLADESHTTALGVNPTTRYVYDGSAWAFQYVVNNTSLTQAQVDAINSGITALLVSWLSNFKGTDTATTLQSLLTALAGKAPTASPSFTGTVGIAGVGGSQGASLTAQGGRLINNGDTLANADDIPYAAAESPSAMDASDRVVTRYKVAAGTPLIITLPEISAENKFVVNLDLEIDTIGVTTLPAITIQPATGGKVYAVKGTMPEIKADCITMIDATSVPGRNAWTIIGASELKEVANA